MNGIKMSDCRFYVNEAERTIVCVIPKTKDMLYDYIYEHFTFSDFDMNSCMEYRLIDEIIEMPSSFMGKAVCSAEDEWNEELGRKIAFSRAKHKCYRSFFKRANTFINALDRRMGDMIESFNSLGKQLEDKRDGLQHQIDEALGK